MKVGEIEDLILATVKVKIEPVMMNGHQLARPVLDTISVHKAAARLAGDVVVLDSELLKAAKALQDKIDNITTEDFSKGGEKPEREALRAILAKTCGESEAA